MFIPYCRIVQIKSQITVHNNSDKLESSADNIFYPLTLWNKAEWIKLEAIKWSLVHMWRGLTWNYLFGYFQCKSRAWGWFQLPLSDSVAADCIELQVVFLALQLCMCIVLNKTAEGCLGKFAKGGACYQMWDLEGEMLNCNVPRSKK